MKAAVHSRYGPPEVVQIKNVAKPAPKDNEVLVRIHATTVCAADWRLRKADPFIVRFINGFWRPKIAKHFGAHVTGCSTANLDLVKSLGADEVVDYTNDHFSRAGQVYDIVFDTALQSVTLF